MNNVNYPEWQYSEFTKFLFRHSYIVLEHFKCEVRDNHVPIFATDLQGEIIFANSIALNSYGNRHKNIVGLQITKVLQFIKTSKRSKKRHHWDQLLREGLLIGADLEKIVRLEDGSEKPVKLTGSLIFDPSGNIKGGAFCVKDNKGAQTDTKKKSSGKPSVLQEKVAIQRQ